MATLGDFFDRLDVWIKNSSNQLIKDFYEDWLTNTEGPMWRKSRKLEIGHPNTTELIGWFIEESREFFIDNPKLAEASLQERTMFAHSGEELLRSANNILSELLPILSVSIHSPTISKSVM